MGKALVIISLACVVAIVAMAAMVLTSFDHREEVQFQQDILATKTAESRDSPSTRDRNEATNVYNDFAIPAESKDSIDSLKLHQTEGLSPGQ